MVDFRSCNIDCVLCDSSLDNDDDYIYKQITMAKIKKAQAGGVTKSVKRVGPVDPDGAWTKVQKRNLPPAPMKKGGKLSKKK